MELNLEQAAMPYCERCKRTVESISIEKTALETIVTVECHGERLRVSDMRGVLREEH